MVKSFDVVYDDFSGGHFVGPVNTKQPKNTFQGANIAVCSTDGTLLPLKAFWDVTGAISGDTAANTSRMLLDSVSGYVVWAGDTSAYRMTGLGAGAPPATITSVAIGADARPNSLPVAYHSKVLFPATTGNIISYNAAANTAALIVPGFIPQLLCVYGEFVMAVSASQLNVIFFSNPADETIWTIATDFIMVGAPGDSILGMCTHQGNLFIATSIGMWVLTGIPGQTATLRQITTTPFTEPFSIDTSIVRTFGVQGAAVSEIAGSNQRALNYGLAPDGRPVLLAGAGAARVNTTIAFAYSDIGSVTDEGAIVTDLGATLWVLDFYNGRWSRRQVTRNPVRMGSMQSTFAHLMYRAGSPDAETIWIAPSYAEELVANNDGSPSVGTVRLAEYFHPVPFTVKEVFVEVDYGSVQTNFDGYSTGSAAAYLAANRGIAVSVETPGVPIEGEYDLVQSRSASSILSQALPPVGVAGVNYTRRRSFVRFRPTDGSDTFTVTPVVTLTGVKLRRLILRCSEVS